MQKMLIVPSVLTAIAMMLVKPPASTADTIDLWVAAEAPFFQSSNLEEKLDENCWGGVPCLLDVVWPTLTLYAAPGNESGRAVLVIPGGGYESVAVFHEGHDIATALVAQGVSAAVLKYRLPRSEASTHPQHVPLSDVRRALSIMRQHGKELGLQDGQVGVLGFSAGSHLATVASLWKSEKSEENPDFSVFVYGVTKLTPANQEWLEKTLYHRDLTPEEIVQERLLDLVSPQSPPAF